MRLKVTKVTKRVRDWRDRQEKVRVYIDVHGENVFDNIVNRTSRPYQLYKREVMPRVLEELGLPADTKFRWDKHCGCRMCPCSPGFVVEAPERVDVWATVESADPKGDPMAHAVDDKADHGKRLARAESLDADPTLPVSLTPEARAFIEEVDDATS